MRIICASMPTLTTSLFSEGSWLRELLWILAASAMLAVMSQVVIPWYPVPLTGQTLAVLFIGAALGARRGVTAVLLYILAGVVGMPIFASMHSGFPAMTGGYLLGFIPAAYIVGYAAERGKDRNVQTALPAFLLGYLCIFVFGVSWIAMFIGWSHAMWSGFVIFIPAELLKVILLSFLLPVLWKITRQ